MKLTRKSLVVIISFLAIGGLTAGIFWRTQDKGYTSATTKEGFINDLQNSVARGLDRNRSRQGLIDSYCATTSELQGFADASAEGLYYDPKQSVFLSLLCMHSSESRDDVKDLVKDYDREDLNINGCTRNGNMTTCDFSVFLPKLFSIVMNDLSKVKLAQLYSYQGSSTDEAIKAFSDTYFGPGDSVCGSTNVIYLGKTQGSPTEAPCMHPQTRNILSQFLQQAQKIADQTIYIDSKALLVPQSDNCEKNPEDFLVCAFDTSNTYSWASFHNTVYNELLFYKLFIVLVNDRIQFPDYNRFKAFSNTNEQAQQEIIRLSQELTLSQEAVIYTEKTLQNMQVAFPIHIGLLAYYEDIVAFRKSLLRIYTPIHQLYYKLRNVQQKQ